MSYLNFWLEVAKPEHIGWMWPTDTFRWIQQSGFDKICISGKYFKKLGNFTWESLFLASLGKLENLETWQTAEKFQVVFLQVWWFFEFYNWGKINTCFVVQFTSTGLIAGWVIFETKKNHVFWFFSWMNHLVNSETQGPPSSWDVKKNSYWCKI